ncbi:MAG: hypothetical protein WAM60_03395, partial [Candidatus Promineifilaceae bacterium]
MPEYLSPGVYIEETSYRSKTIEGVSTSTAGFVGSARFGPVSGQPELVTSLADYQRIFGDLEDLTFTDQDNPTVNYLAHGVRAFFEEGGRRLFVQRVFNTPDGFDITDGVPANHYATGNTPDGSTTAADGFNIVARFPGAAGNMQITFALIVGRNVYRENTDGGNHFLTRLSNNSLVHVRTVDTSTDPDTITAQGTANGLMIARRNPANGAWELFDNDPDGSTPSVTQDLSSTGTVPAGLQVRPVTVLVEVARPAAQPNEFDEPETLGEFSFVQTARNALLSTFTPNPDNRFAALTTPFALVDMDADEQFAITLAQNLMSTDMLDSLSTADEEDTIAYTLSGGDDGELPIPITYAGDPDFDDLTADPLQMPLNGFLAFEAVEDISIVAAPGYSASPEDDDVLGIQNALINHCERMRYRVAVLDTPPNQTTTEALEFRNLRSSEYAALYYPWVIVSDPRPSQG